jgi:AcrR family transcriptional regulator
MSGLALRKQQANETRRKILIAARELFEELGYHGASVSRIAARAGVAKGTFFVHFPTKDAAVNALVSVQMRAAYRARDDARQSGATPILAARAALIALAEHGGLSRTLNRAVWAAMFSNDEVSGELRSMWSGLRDVLAEDIPDDTLLSSLMSLYLGTAVWFSNDPATPDLVPKVTELIDSVLASHRSDG